MSAWDVYTYNPYGRDQQIDTVYFDNDCDAEYVYNSLVNHDDYNPAIYVESGNKRFNHPDDQ